MHQNAKNVLHIVLQLLYCKHQAENGGPKVPKYNVGELISSSGIDSYSLCQNQRLDDIVF